MVDLISGYSNKKKSKHIKKLVLFLHGYGADGSDLINISNIWEEFLPEVAFYSPNAPFKCEINPYGYQWFSLNERTENEIKSGLEITEPYVKKYVEHINKHVKNQFGELVWDLRLGNWAPEAERVAARVPGEPLGAV